MKIICTPQQLLLSRFYYIRMMVRRNVDEIHRNRIFLRPVFRGTRIIKFQCETAHR